MKKLNAFLIIIISVRPAVSQEWDAELTEQWEPVPEVVTPGLGTAPPSDAVVLLDGSGLEEWESTKGGPAEWDFSEGVMTVIKGKGGIRTKKTFGDIQLHIEWRTPSVIEGKGQGRGNSGIFIQERYEVQVLDSYENITYPNGQAGSVYKQHIPLVNASRQPGKWQSYDIIFTAPRFREDGSLFTPAKLTVIHNGVLIQNHVTIKGATVFKGLPAYNEHDLKQSIMLQDHKNPVSYRNIWIREL